MISIGGAGVISVIANAFPKQMSDLVNSALKNEYETARKIQYELIDLIEAIFEDGNPAGVKAALSILGIAKNYTRLPIVPVNERVFEKLSKLISN